MIGIEIPTYFAYFGPIKRIGSLNESLTRFRNTRIEQEEGY